MKPAFNKKADSKNAAPPRFLFQKFLWNFSFPLAFLSFLGVLGYAFFTEVTMTEPGDVAPFSATLTNETPTTAGFEALPIDQPNRTARELAEWLNTAIPEILSLSGAQYDQQIADVKKYFTEDGYAQFTGYVGEAGLYPALTAGDLRISAYVDSAPLLLNDGTVGGVYRWLYDVPVTMSYLPRTATEYTVQTNAQVRQVTVRLQLGRIDKPDEPEAVRIESWAVSARRT